MEARLFGDVALGAGIRGGYVMGLAVGLVAFGAPGVALLHAQLALGHVERIGVTVGAVGVFGDVFLVREGDVAVGAVVGDVGGGCRGGVGGGAHQAPTGGGEQADNGQAEQHLLHRDLRE